MAKSKTGNKKKNSKKKKKNFKFNTNRVGRKFLKGLLKIRSRNDQDLMLAKIKHAYPYEEGLLILKALKSTPYRNIVFGNAIPKKYSLLAKTIQHNQPSSEFKKEISWLVLCLEHHSELINEFVKYRDEFESTFIGGDYDKAFKIVEEVEKNICVSLWSLEKKILAVEYRDGVKFNRQLIGEIAEEGNEPIIDMFADTLSMRSESNISVEKYDMEIDRFVEYFESMDARSFAEYIKYHLNFFSAPPPERLSNIIFHDGKLSIIDRYMTFMYVTQLFILNNREEGKTLEKYIARLNNCVDDSAIHNLLILLNPSVGIINDESYRRKMRSIDYYTCGEYGKCIIESEEGLRFCPSDFEYYGLYVKSHIHLNRELKIIEKNVPSIKTELLYLLYEIYGKAGSLEKPLDRLKKIVQLLGKSSISFPLYNLYQNESSYKPNKIYKLLYYANAKHVTPLFSKIYEQNEKALCLLNNINDSYPSSITVKMFTSGDSNYQDSCSTHSCLNSVELRKSIYTAKTLYRAESYVESISLFESVKSEMLPISTRSDLYMFDQIVYYLFKEYLENNEYKNCIRLYLESYFLNNNICKKLNLKKIIDIFDSDIATEFYNYVYYPVVSYIYHGISWQTYVAYDNFIFSLGLSKASDISSETYAGEIQLFVKFLSDVCVPEIYYHSVYFESTEELENERIAICQRLIEIDPGNSDKYSVEIGEITQKSMIRRGIRQVEESKIYVDINGIIKAGEKTLFESFSRYKEFSSFSDKDEVTFLDVSEPLLKSILGDKNVSSETKPVKTKEEDTVYKPWIKANAGYRLFVELFYNIRDRFVSSNEYGLDSYLSVRIRHGTLLGHLRRQFESESLITQKDESAGGMYQDNDYWAAKLEDIGEESNNIIQESFKELSVNIDQIIVNLRDIYLQVRTERKNPRGLFNYTFNAFELGVFYKDKISPAMEYEEFLTSIFDCLWQRTSENLKVIRSILHNNLQKEILGFLNSFEEKIKNALINENASSDLLRAISTCRTNIQQELENLSKWFTLSQSKFIHNFDLEMAIHTAIEIINNTHPTIDFNPTIEVGFSGKLDGAHFAAFIDLLMILFNNIVEHSGCEDNKTTIVNVWQENRKIQIECINEVSSEYDIKDILSKMNNLRDLFINNHGTGYVRREGNSGLHKILNIVKNVLRDTNNDIGFSLHNEHTLSVLVTINKQGLMI